VAKEELGETLSSKNIGDLNLQLESIAQVMNTADVCEKGCGCGCKIGETLDDE
jgi:hypothetical protein